MAKGIVVVPTIRQSNAEEFLAAWRQEFQREDLHVILVEDNPEQTFETGGEAVTHYCWKDIDSELGKENWIIPRRTDCIRSYGYWKAYLLSPDFVITLDDDCLPAGEGFVGSHLRRLEQGEEAGWVSTLAGARPRGMPYYSIARRGRCVLNHGLWSNVPDYDAVTQLMSSRLSVEFSFVDQTIPVGKYFPMCGMNLAFRPEVVPSLYFLLMGSGHPYDRLGDIWAGVILKKICDHLGFAVNSGSPIVDHRRASNVWSNLRKEAPGLEVNETFWQSVDAVVLTKTTFKDCYLEVADKLVMKGEYWDKLRRAMRIWGELF